MTIMHGPNGTILNSVGYWLKVYVDLSLVNNYIQSEKNLYHDATECYFLHFPDTLKWLAPVR